MARACEHINTQQVPYTLVEGQVTPLAFLYNAVDRGKAPPLVDWLERCDDCGAIDRGGDGWHWPSDIERAAAIGEGGL